MRIIKNPQLISLIPLEVPNKILSFQRLQQEEFLKTSQSTRKQKGPKFRLANDCNQVLVFFKSKFPTMTRFRSSQSPPSARSKKNYMLFSLRMKKVAIEKSGKRKLFCLYFHILILILSNLICLLFYQIKLCN